MINWEDIFATFITDELGKKPNNLVGKNDQRTRKDNLQ